MRLRSYPKEKPSFTTASLSKSSARNASKGAHAALVGSATAKRSTTNASERVATCRMLTGVREPGFHSPSRPTRGGYPSRVDGLRAGSSVAARIAATPAASLTQCTRSRGTGGSVCPRSTPRDRLVSAAGRAAGPRRGRHRGRRRVVRHGGGARRDERAVPTRGGTRERPERRPTPTRRDATRRPGAASGAPASGWDIAPEKLTRARREVRAGGARRPTRRPREGYRDRAAESGRAAGAADAESLKSWSYGRHRTVTPE